MERQLKSPKTEIERIIEISPHTLYFAVLRGTTKGRRLKCDRDLFYFTVDEELIYQNYNCDFGPLNISCLYKYCLKVNKYLQYAKGRKGIVHYTTSHLNRKTNAAYLMGCFCVLYLKMLPKEAMKLLEKAGPFKPFLDASPFTCAFTLEMLDCFQAIVKGNKFHFFNFVDFNSSEYDLYNKLEYGDINWLLPRKFLAFIGPADNNIAHSPEFYIKYFLKNDVKTVIRLNNVIYDAYVLCLEQSHDEAMTFYRKGSNYSFMQVGIQHYDLFFPDGSTPSKGILLKFLHIVECAPAAIGVHCKAGLGRTGSLIGAYLIKHYRMTAREAIAWLRICRPGTVIGQQQMWLENIQSWLWKIGNQYRLQHYGEGGRIPKHKYGIYSKLWPIEREKLIRECPPKCKLNRCDRLLEMHSKLPPLSADNFNSISNLLSSAHGTRNEVLKKQISQTARSVRYSSEQTVSNATEQKSSTRAVVNKTLEHMKKTTQRDKLNEIKVQHN